MHIFDTQQHSLNHIRTARSVKSVPHIKASPRRRLSDSQSSYSYVWLKTPGEKWLFHFLMSRFLSFLSNILNLYHPHLDTIHLFNCESGGIKEKHYCRQHQWWLKENHEAALPGESYLPSALITVVICWFKQTHPDNVSIIYFFFFFSTTEVDFNRMCWQQLAPSHQPGRQCPLVSKLSHPCELSSPARPSTTHMAQTEDIPLPSGCHSSLNGHESAPPDESLPSKHHGAVVGHLIL